MARLPDSTTRAGADRSAAVTRTASERGQRQTMATSVAPESDGRFTGNVIGGSDPAAALQFSSQRISESLINPAGS